MNIGVIFIASAFEVRLKNKDKPLLKQHERFKMAQMLQEIDKWTNESVHSPQVLVVTCFDEIYDLCVNRHIKVKKNIFGLISEGNMIRAGILEMPGYEAYIVLSTAQPRLVNAGLLENLSNLYLNHSGKTIVTRYRDKPQFPIAFSIKNAELIDSMLYKDKGKFIIKSNGRKIIYFDATDDFLGQPVVHKKLKDYITGESKSLTGDDEFQKVVVVRGGGVIGSAVAISLYEAGYKVVITERENPSTLFRKMTYACVVHDSEKTVNGITGYLVSPGIRQVEKAWAARVIPVIIDPELVFTKHFENIDLQNEKLNLTSDYLEFAEEQKDSSFHKYLLLALIDCTGENDFIAFPDIENTTLIGIRGKKYNKIKPEYLIETTFNSQYGVIHLHKEIELSRIDENENKNHIHSKQNDYKVEIYKELFCPAEGKFREIMRIGDYAKENSLIAQIVSNKSEKIDIFTTISGRIIANRESGQYCQNGDVACVIDPSSKSPEDCFSLNPINLVPGTSIVKLLNGFNT